jgi:rhamnosyltransferase
VYRLPPGPCFEEFERRMQELRQALGLVVLVDNNPQADQRLNALEAGGMRVVHQANRGGLAGGFNAGIRAAIAAGVQWITLLDQDSAVDPLALVRLQEAWQRHPGRLLLVGPAIRDLDAEPGCVQDTSGSDPYARPRLLISSGTTFCSCDWDRLGPFHTELFIDFLDHIWCFRAAARGCLLLQDQRVELAQRFGAPHPQPLCRWLGMKLYSPQRHYYGLRNLRWLCRQPEVPLDLKVKEVLKMLVKPWLWLLFEPRRPANARAICAGLTDPLPGPHP